MSVLLSAPNRLWKIMVESRVIAFGTYCVTAFALRRLGLDEAPMPFDWLETSPAMIRHCLSSDFSFLLDRTQYRSVTGLRGPAHPAAGCAHEYYASEHGLAYVFNHNDPTRDADYRYLVACVERFRQVLASGGRTVFVQVRHAYGSAVRDFEANYILLDQVSRGGHLLQIVVNPPNASLRAPLFSVVGSHGAHTLYQMQPTSKMTGTGFPEAVDNEGLDGLIANYARSGRAGFTVERIVVAAASADVDVDAALGNAMLVAHIADRGDIKPDQAGWAGGPGSGLPMQGIAIHSDVELIREGLRYQVAEQPGQFTAAAEAGHYLGTKGMGKPIYGLRVLLADTVLEKYLVSIEAGFVDGSVQGPMLDCGPFEVLSEVPLSALRLLIVERR